MCSTIIKLIGKTITPMTDEQREQYNGPVDEDWNGGDGQDD